MKYIILFFCALFPIFGTEQILLLLGPPGAGKGTFSQYLKHNYGYQHFAFGDMVRREIAEGTPFGKMAAEILSRGEFLDEAMVQALAAYQIALLVQDDAPLIIDGFPRTGEAARFLKSFFEQLELKDKVVAVFLEADDSTCLDRILHRITCKECGQVYNSMYAPPKQEMICDFCCAPLNSRPFDDLPVIQKRLEKYHELIEDTVAICNENFVFIHFNSQLPIEECYQQYDQFINP